MQTRTTTDRDYRLPTGMYLAIATVPAAITGLAALAIGGSLGEALLSGGMALAAAGVAGASVLGLGRAGGRQAAIAACVAVALALLLGCYAYGRAAGIPTDDLRTGMGVVLLALGLAGVANGAIGLARAGGGVRG